MTYIFGFMDSENSSCYYMMYSSEIIGTAGHWSVKLMQFIFILKIHYYAVSRVICVF